MIKEVILHSLKVNLIFKFQIDNVHWIYNILNQGLTNKSAFKQIDEVIIALSGSFDILVISKDNKEEILISITLIKVYTYQK